MTSNHTKVNVETKKILRKQNDNINFNTFRNYTT